MLKILNCDNVYRREREFADLSLLECTKISATPSWSISEGMLPSFRLIAVVGGAVELYVNKTLSVTLEDRDVLLIAPNSHISSNSVSGAPNVWMLRFDCDNFLFFNFDGPYAKAKISSTAIGMLDEISSDLSHSSRPLYCCEARTVLVLDELRRHLLADAGKQEIYGEVCRYIRENIEKELDVKTVSHAMGYNSDYLSRIIKECGGINLNRLIIDERLTNAKGLLKFTELSCQRIAAMTGISTANKFVKFFKYHTGETPSEYRSRSKNSV